MQRTQPLALRVGEGNLHAASLINGFRFLLRDEFSLVKQVGEKVARKRYSSDLSTRDWQELEPLLVVRRRSKWPLVEVVNAILYVLKNGCMWRDLPGDLPPQLARV
ncbi:transposase [Hymenobacter baengnokdamensis]|uniref:transposase n=1 Tax=Hymenobacter baengnokdamensis TaxID=2615203 RepID=UPI00177E98BB|nr:transposase [Hymenobacter baengnokdamensis]